MLYIGTALGVMNQTGSIGTRLLLVMLVESDEVARSQGVMAVCAATARMLEPAYNAIYNATLDWHPGFIYCLASVLSILAICIFSGVHAFLVRQQRNNKTVDKYPNFAVFRFC